MKWVLAIALSYLLVATGICLILFMMKNGGSTSLQVNALLLLASGWMWKKYVETMNRQERRRRKKRRISNE